MKARFLWWLWSRCCSSAAVVMPAAAQTSKTLEIYIAGATDDTLKWFNEHRLPGLPDRSPGCGARHHHRRLGRLRRFRRRLDHDWQRPDIVYLGSEYAATFGDLLTDMDPYLKDWDRTINLPARPRLTP